MGRRYQQFSLEERCEIASRRVGGESIRQIAAALDRAPSSVSRELKRNASRSVAYSRPMLANKPKPGAGAGAGCCAIPTFKPRSSTAWAAAM
jgi:IS30 family transposase